MALGIDLDKIVYFNAQHLNEHNFSAFVNKNRMLDHLVTNDRVNAFVLTLIDEGWAVKHMPQYIEALNFDANGILHAALYLSFETHEVISVLRNYSDQAVIQTRFEKLQEENNTP